MFIWANAWSIAAPCCALYDSELYSSFTNSIFSTPQTFIVSRFQALSFLKKESTFKINIINNIAITIT